MEHKEIGNIKEEKPRNNLGIVIGLIIIVGLIYLFFGRGDTWIGFYYPDAFDLTRHIQSPEFKSIEECRLWVDGQQRTFNPSGEGYDYECGKNCRFDKDFGAYICKETIR